MGVSTHWGDSGFDGDLAIGWLTVQPMGIAVVSTCRSMLGAICLDNNIKFREIKELTGDHDEEKFRLTWFKRWMGYMVLILIVCTEFVSVLLAILYPPPKFAVDIRWYILLLLDVIALMGSIYLVVYMHELCAGKKKAL